MKKIILISDTHSYHHNIHIEQEKADIIICSGDFSLTKEYKHDSYFESTIIDFIDWYSKLNIPIKILISGNSDGMHIQKNELMFKEECEKKGINYLIDESIMIGDLKVYGTPWVKEHSANKGYALSTEEELLVKYNKIPLDTNLLITHTPPFNILDKEDGNHYGSISLKNRLNDLKELKYSFFGHIHKGNGEIKIGEVLFVNAAYSKATPYRVLLI